MPIGGIGIDGEKKPTNKREKIIRKKDSKDKPIEAPIMHIEGTHVEEEINRGPDIADIPVMKFEVPQPPVQPQQPTQQPTQPPVQRPVTGTPYNAPSWSVMADARLPILLVGETQEIMADFLCGMRQNVDEIFPKGGITYFTNDSFTLGEMTRVKKGIEQCFRGDHAVRWPTYSDEENAFEKVYSFSITKAGTPENGIELQFICVTPDRNINDLINRFSVVWVLANGRMPQEAETSYDVMLKQFLLAAGSALEGRAVEMIITRFEKHGYYHYEGANAEIPGDLKKSLYESVKKSYGDVFAQTAPKAKMCAAQIYGGLEPCAKDEYGRTFYYANPDNRCGMYAPTGCHVPLLHTLSAIRNSGEGYLSQPKGEEIWYGIQTSFADYIGVKQWEPQNIV